MSEKRGKKFVGRNVAIVLGIVYIILLGGWIESFAYYLLLVNDKDNKISSMNIQISQLNATISQLQADLTVLRNELKSDNSTIYSQNSQISRLHSNVTNLQNQIASDNTTINILNSEIFDLENEITSLESSILNSSGLIGYWKFDEGNGNVVSDSSGNGNNGTVYGAMWASGEIGYALNFDGVDDYVSIPSWNLSSLTSLTVAAWINSPLNNNGCIFCGQNGEFMLHNDADVVGFSVKLQGEWYDVFSNSTITPNSWHYIVGVWTKGVCIKIYVDGILVGENDTIPDAYIFSPGPSYTARMGADYSGQSFFHGSIDEVRIYNRAFNYSDVFSLYSSYP